MALDEKIIKNKMQKADTTKDTVAGVEGVEKGAVLNAYFFPDYQCTIHAPTREQALAELRKKFPDAVIEE